LKNGLDGLAATLAVICISPCRAFYAALIRPPVASAPGSCRNPPEDSYAFLRPSPKIIGDRCIPQRIANVAHGLTDYANLIKEKLTPREISFLTFLIATRQKCQKLRQMLRLSSKLTGYRSRTAANATSNFSSLTFSLVWV
jgi:hypothetical protein